MCQHLVHVNCFISFEKSGYLEFNCPLCSKKSNCFFPVEFDPSDVRTNRIFFNVIVATQAVIYKYYETDNYFLPIFKHVVESRGLQSLISFSQT